MCGLRNKWNKKVGVHRICTHHKLAIRDRLQGKCQYLIVGNLKIPISPDGIPMVNLATAISKTEGANNNDSDDDLERGSSEEESVDEETKRATGLLMMFSWSRIPKIAGDNYRPAAWIPYKEIPDEDRAELERVERRKSAKKVESLSLGDGEIAYLVHSGSCPEFVKLREYPTSDANSDFPLAYSMVLHKNPGQAERLLRAIYSPHNVYCLHIDAKTPQMEVDDFEALASCFPNVFLTKKRENVHWGSYERFQADINCMGDLIQEEWHRKPLPDINMAYRHNT
ncbi:Oidioi.mRNA.OKI2018_I69.PAR.g12597.t1.cds [Oikopleura dioica]|uniref:Oidioi.mRNA.OKI2018_I69.PAR.g12597.t1.cds n=1 Tax=Oikopleura dioica TaxID=34765 RepID=A0ABN7S413_OIKDI|nr:Oidioi.mRNA.OKI2018_I69.PAR.g12597.t1.cds [Oikopleura dioica]